MTTPNEPAPNAAPAGDPQATQQQGQAQPPAPTPAADDRPLGPAGERALAAEREARKALEKQLAPFLALVGGGGAAGGDQGKPDPLAALQERLASHETELKAEREARWRAEVATASGLTLDQAARLRGATREELLADAAALKALFPAAPAGAQGGASGTPAPDPSQGARGVPDDIDAQIEAATKAGRYADAIALKRVKAKKK
jgi:hypothetical protein